MPSKQSKTLFEFRTARKDVNEWIKGVVRYEIGGMNYFSGSTMLRGYYLSVGPEERGDHFVKFAAFSAPTVLIQQAARYSERVLKDLIPDPALVESLTAKVLSNLKARGGC